MKPLISYVRVSTDKQGRSGLGIEAQQAAIVRFAEAEGYKVVGEFLEVETGKGADADRKKTAASGEQDADRMHQAEDGEQDADRTRTAKDDEDNGRFEGQEDSEDQIMNNDEYDAGADDYGVNKPKTAGGSNPAGREDSMTKVPTETEETPDDTVFAVDTQNVMSDKSMRVKQVKSGESRQAVKGGAIDHAEGKKKQLSGDFEGDVAETVGPDGAYAEVPGGEKKAKGKHLTPGAMDEADEAAETVGPDGAFAEEHGEKKQPYTKTGFGSTYEEEGKEGVEDEDDFNELSADHCGMNYGMGSMGQAKPMGMESMYEELKALKAENERMKREYQEAKMTARKDKLASFVEGLYESGKLTDGIMPQSELQSYCEGLEFGTLEFSEGESAATKLLGLLNRLPNMVEYGEVVAGGTFQYSDEELDPHTRALQLVEKGDCSDYVEAIKKVMYS
jgi:hypothetical protein